MNTSTKKNKIARAATLLLLVLLSAANALAQTRWQGNGTEQSPYRINSTEDLEALADSVNSGTSYAGKFFRLEADLTYDTATQNNHTAIGTGGKPFKGTFDGNNHTISGIRINNNNYDQGLFGRCENSTVKNLMLTDAKITGSDFVGGIASRNFGSSIEDCQVANNVTVSGEEYVGGIAGINAGSIKNCQVANNVTVSGEDYIGGIAGSNPGSIKDCQVVNNVTVSGEDYIGGIVGWSYGGSSVENCLVSNNVTVSGEDYIGGIVGNIDNSSIKDCQVSNYVTVSGSDDWVGGIVGWSYSDGSIENCHVANNVTISGSGLIGGIAGLSSNSSSIEDCQVAINITINGSTIVGGSYIPNLRRNYYLGCTVGATDVGTFEGDITENNGAVPGYLLTLGEHITSDAVSFTIPAYDEMPETTYHVAPSGDTITLGYELAGCEVTYYVNGEAIAGNTFIMPAEDVSVMAVWTDYTIYTAADWELFCDALQDNATYNRFIGDTVQLAADITVTRMAGSSSHDFMGTFDGQGHTLTVAYGSAENPITEEYAAPFRNLENGAVIRNLHVDGHIYTSNKFASGLAGCLWGTVTISDCRSSVIIHSSKQGDGTHGGIVAVHHNTLTVNGCVFDGRLLTTNGTTLCGGLIGYHYGTLTLSDCLYAPATDVTLAEGETYITNGATFCRNYSGALANCYYTETLGTAQGKLAHSITSEDVTLAFAGEVTEYNVSGITSYGTGIMYGSVLYAGNGDEVGLTFSAPEGFSVVSATYTPEDGMATELTFADGVYSFTMPDANVVIDAVTEYLIHNATEWNNFCDALQDNDTYNRFIGKTVKLDADISVTRMAGSSTHDFMGTFDGQGHTLTVAYGTAENPISEKYAAPFHYVETGAVIHSLHVEGHIYTSNQYASGVVGCQYGTVSVSNCRSSVIIHSSINGNGTHGGIVAVQHGGTLTMSGCVYDGRLLTTNGTTLCGGLVGWRYGTCTLSDCLYAPAEVTPASGEINITDGATLCRNYSGTPANCYYTETLGAAQGKLAHSITSGEGVLMERAGEATGYDISGITSYGTGIMYDSVLYAGNGDEVSLNLTIPEGFSVVAATYTPEGGTATELTPVNGVYSFTMPNADVVIEVVTEYIIHNATEWGNFCDALQDNDTYNRFIGKTVRLANDITVTRMAGSSYHDFMGTFDGQGHTLTLAYGSAESPISEEYAAPFRNVENGCVIENLHVDGTITTASKYAAGIVAQQYGTVTIRNCRSSVTIQSSIEGDGTHGGLVGVKGNSNDANLTIEGCTFDGKIVSTGSTATTNCGGFVGWRSNSGSLTITNSLYAPTADDNAVSSGATFARNWTMPDDANCYYTEALGAAQGKLALTNPAVLPVGEPTATYDVSSLTLYGNGIQFGEVFYYDTERNFLRTIAGYGTGDDGWNLVASPVANGITPTAANGFLTEAYDLFRFNQAADLEWENWKDTVYDNYHYDLASGRGYLYASQTETTLVFSGTPYSGTGEVTLTKTDGIEFSGWNLVGNPFATAKTIGSKPFYRMNDLGTEIIAAETDTIAAMEGIFVVATTDGETVTFAEPTRGGESEERIIINLCDNAAVIDRAIVRLGEGEMLPKLQIRKGNTKVYIPQGGEEYAIVCAGRDAMHCVPTEIPVNFKAKEDGTYTISINPEVVEMGYLHLIDNLIGADVDLLTPLAFGHPLSEGATPPNPLSEGEAQSDAEIGEATAAGRFPLCKGGQGDSNPTYTFTAKTTDYESRFKLVFNANAEDGSSTGSASDEAFAFISNGQLILTSEGSLQVFDALGRQLFAKDVTTFNSQLSTLNFPSPGVYVLRLINGNDMKTQKMVIE